MKTAKKHFDEWGGKPITSVPWLYSLMVECYAQGANDMKERIFEKLDRINLKGSLETITPTHCGADISNSLRVVDLEH